MSAEMTAEIYNLCIRCEEIVVFIDTGCAKDVVT